MQDLQSMMLQRRLRGYAPPLGEAAPPPPIKCPRCDSANTKFCYYNNYNLSQPRHFCKACRRYWTKGGVLRNVPVGGGSRKSSSKRSSSSSSSKKPSSAVADNDRSCPPASRSSSDTSSLSNPKPNPSSPRHPPSDPNPDTGGSLTGLIAVAEQTTAAMGFGFTDSTAGAPDLGPRMGGGEIHGMDVFDLGEFLNQSQWSEADSNPDPSSLFLP